ncbi:unnamed protein product [Adineta steineri]|uniref:Uncharacterized protein n=1 Tax=Adineta steineri TaxID=433720 RepID=A0A819UNW8_9BILA|nr:unnamed protein product [Adineta steineri]
MIDVIYSFVDITERFNQLVFDPFYIRNFNMTSMTMKSFYDRIYSIDNQVLDNICKNILPRISHQINELIVEQYSMERVLHTMNYPQLYSLTLIDFSEEVLFNYLTNNTILRTLLNQQITCLTIDVKDKPTEQSSSETLWIIFTLILSLCKQLNKLSFCQFDKDNIKKLPKLKHFSLTSYPHTFLYDNLIIPLIRRMINLEELILDLSIIRSAHADYAEQFLIDKYCHLPCLLNLDIDYESLVLVTNNFTNDAIHLTCSKLTNLRINEPLVPPKTFYQYFPLL